MSKLGAKAYCDCTWPLDRDPANVRVGFSLLNYISCGCSEKSLGHMAEIRLVIQKLLSKRAATAHNRRKPVVVLSKVALCYSFLLIKEA
jgi:hypothetical protein